MTLDGRARPNSVTSLMAAGPVTLTVDHMGIAKITLNRPEAANAMDAEMLSALHAALLRCHSLPDIRVVVMTGAGDNFCSGGDIKDFLGHAERLRSHIKEVSTWLQSVTAMLIGLDVPVIGAVHGYAAGGGGLGLVGSCDFVIASRSAKFMSGAVRVGMIPDGGLTATLTRLVGLRKAMEITLTNPTLDADEALRIGLITRVVADDDLMAEADSLAELFVESAPLALAECKQLLWDGIGSPVSRALAAEARAVVRLAASKDCVEGLEAAAQKRRPLFRGV